MNAPSILNHRDSKSESAYNRIKEDIVKGNLREGEPLFERRLCEYYGVSRTPIREALKRLSNENYVRITPSMGAYVAEITSDLILEIYNIREVLEGLACRLYASKARNESKRELKAITNNFVRLMKAQEYEKALKLDLSFHEKIKLECGSPTLIDMLSPIAEQIARITKATHYDLDWAREAVRMHVKICDALLDGKAAEAEAAMREHMATSRNRHIETII